MRLHHASNNAMGFLGGQTRAELLLFLYPHYEHLASVLRAVTLKSS